MPSHYSAPSPLVQKHVRPLSSYGFVLNLHPSTPLHCQTPCLPLWHWLPALTTRCLLPLFVFPIVTMAPEPQHIHQVLLEDDVHWYSPTLSKVVRPKKTSQDKQASQLGNKSPTTSTDASKEPASDPMKAGRGLRKHSYMRLLWSHQHTNSYQRLAQMIWYSCHNYHPSWYSISD